MREIELKILNISVPTISKKLLKLGAKKIKIQKIVDLTFDFPDERINKAGNHLRLRQTGRTFTLTYKEKKSGGKMFKTLEETEVEVSSFADVEIILKKLGLIRAKYQEKKRTSFIKGNLRFEIDEYPGIPPYIELEGTENTILHAIKQLGYEPKDTTPMNASQVLKYYGKNNKMIKFKKSR